MESVQLSSGTVDYEDSRRRRARHRVRRRSRSWMPRLWQQVVPAPRSRLPLRRARAPPRRAPPGDASRRRPVAARARRSPRGVHRAPRSPRRDPRRGRLGRAAAHRRAPSRTHRGPGAVARRGVRQHPARSAGNLRRHRGPDAGRDLSGRADAARAVHAPVADDIRMDGEAADPEAIVASWITGIRNDRGVRRDVAKYVRTSDYKGLEEAAAALAHFDRPTLVLWASEDKVMPPEHGRRLAEIIPNARHARDRRRVHAAAARSTRTRRRPHHVVRRRHRLIRVQLTATCRPAGRRGRFRRGP